jgi:hypothetical protein
MASPSADGSRIDFVLKSLNELRKELRTQTTKLVSDLSKKSTRPQRSSFPLIPSLVEKKQALLRTRLSGVEAKLQEIEVKAPENDSLLSMSHRYFAST